MRGRRLSRLTNEPYVLVSCRFACDLFNITETKAECKHFFYKIAMFFQIIDLIRTDDLHKVKQRQLISLRHSIKDSEFTHLLYRALSYLGTLIDLLL